MESKTNIEAEWRGKYEKKREERSAATLKNIHKVQDEDGRHEITF